MAGRCEQCATAKGEFFFRALQLPRHGNLSVNVAPGRASARTNPQPCKPRRVVLRPAHARQPGHGLPVLLLGETGTGKEVAALHQASAARGQTLRCRQLRGDSRRPDRVQVFGYREAPSPASRRGGMVGRLMQAHGGTLFLDEIGDMPLALQARLLRVLQERRVAPLGAGEEQEIDVALICATHRDLKRLVAEQHFREDLYYRVNGVSLRSAALREQDDLASIIEGLLDKFGAKGVTLDPPLAELLEGFDWPGNIRQLEMVLRTALAMREDDEQVLSLEHLTDCLLDELASGAAPSGSLRENELELIRGALTRHRHVSAAAEASGHQPRHAVPQAQAAAQADMGGLFARLVETSDPQLMRQALAWLYSFVRPHRRAIAMLLGLSLCASLCWPWPSLGWSRP